MAPGRSIVPPDLAETIPLTICGDSCATNRSTVLAPPVEDVHAGRTFKAMAEDSIRCRISGIDAPVVVVAARAGAFNAALGWAMSDFLLKAAMPQLMIATTIHRKMVLWQEVIEVLCIIVLLFLSAVTEIFNEQDEQQAAHKFTLQEEAASFGPNN